MVNAPHLRKGNGHLLQACKCTGTSRKIPEVHPNDPVNMEEVFCPCSQGLEGALPHLGHGQEVKNVSCCVMGTSEHFNTKHGGGKGRVTSVHGSSCALDVLLPLLETHLCPAGEGLLDMSWRNWALSGDQQQVKTFKSLPWDLSCLMPLMTWRGWSTRSRAAL